MEVYIETMMEQLNSGDEELSPGSLCVLSWLVWRQVEEQHGRRRRRKENISVLHWWFMNNSCTSELFKAIQDAQARFYFCEDFHQEDGHSSDLDQKKSGILLILTDHKGNGTESLNWWWSNSEKADTQFSVLWVHCHEERSKAKVVGNYQYTSVPMGIRLKLFFAQIFLLVSSVSTEQSQICVKNVKLAMLEQGELFWQDNLWRQQRQSSDSFLVLSSLVWRQVGSEEEETRKDTSIVLIHQEQFCTSELVKVIQDVVSLILLCRTMSLFRTFSSSTLIT